MSSKNVEEIMVRYIIFYIFLIMPMTVVPLEKQLFLQDLEAIVNNSQYFIFMAVGNFSLIILIIINIKISLIKVMINYFYFKCYM